MLSQPNTRLKVSPIYVQAYTMDGRAYVAKDAEPYSQFWLSERERRLLAVFGRRGGATVAEALQDSSGAAEARRRTSAISDMREAGVLVDPAADPSRYDAKIVRDYVLHRPFPRALSDRVIERAAIGPSTRVLDLAGGPGDLALALAQASGQVALMELSRGFVAAASRRAKQQGLALKTLHDSCNRLAQRDEGYDVITVSQALHWLDDVAVCRGLCRALQAGGSFFVIHSALELDDTHPLAYLLGHDSILGHKQRQSFIDEVRPLQRRLALLFEALDAPEVQRIDAAQQWQGQRIRPDATQLFKQRRPFGIGYARGFLTAQHMAATGQTAEAFWADASARCAAVAPDRLIGTHHWALLQFRRGAAGTAPLRDDEPAPEIRYEGPADA